MNANAEYFENLALFARANNQARRRVSEEFTVTNSEDYRETHMPTSHTLSKQIPATGFDHWDLVSDWHRLSQEKREFEELKRETFEKIASAQEGLISDCDKLSRAQNEFQETKQEMGQALMDLRRDNMMLQRDLYVASIIMSFFAVICFAQRVGLVPQQYGKYQFEILLVLFIFPVERLIDMIQLLYG